ncbi:hypothetical protein WA1_07740 [Scytonema hofmannii PCC 7110]|uniref:Uncharacterized protein n=1 Tax=Scytonema hofmannii PCC 7110 TaxID=128403 RepID=A0A139WTE7_9CYAN|nr:hypothetical protein WA1_07740 [Scytonema hofmannii PCC 7110]
MHAISLVRLALRDKPGTACAKGERLWEKLFGFLNLAVRDEAVQQKSLGRKIIKKIKIVYISS